VPNENQESGEKKVKSKQNNNNSSSNNSNNNNNKKGAKKNGKKSLEEREELDRRNYYKKNLLLTKHGSSINDVTQFWITYILLPPTNVTLFSLHSFLHTVFKKIFLAPLIDSHIGTKVGQFFPKPASVLCHNVLLYKFTQKRNGE